MTEEQIERVVESMTDALDRSFLARGSTMSQLEYDERSRKIVAWAEAQKTVERIGFGFRWERAGRA